jgi:hypothetical protein
MLPELLVALATCRDGSLPAGSGASPPRHGARLEALVTVRITVAEGAPTRLVRLEGRLTGDALPELEHALGDDPAAAVLDLSGLSGADAVAIDGLRRLRARGFSLLRVPPHLAWRIEDHEDEA